VTGSNSLITVPVMFQFGIDEKIAVATNMFGLTFMAIGGTIPFVRAGAVEFRQVWPLAGLTAGASAIGAGLVGLITNQSIKLIVVVAMVVVVIFTLVKPDFAKRVRPEIHAAVGMAAVFFLGVYGGLYSGGYITVLTPTLVAFYGMSYAQSIAATKFINVFSSGIATIVFIWQGLVDYQLGVILGVTMFAGAYIGAHYASKMNEIWLKRIFVTSVILLAFKTTVDLI
ncbi:MAG TPA: sulfite exporter TauE/SafE family protein, partial [Pyrinomonadaceae bacterium]|nr:sulfite exporter TauE/SafE family protein [Pyrinomonadaceae bacterium]